MRIGVVTFPGSLDDQDAARAVRYAGAEPVALDALAGVVATRLAHDRQKIVFFDVDDHANYGTTVRVMDICKGAGAKTLGIVTRD